MQEIKTKIKTYNEFSFYIINNDLNCVASTRCRDSILFYFIKNNTCKLGLYEKHPEKLEAVLKHVNSLLDVENSNTYYDKENSIWCMDVNEFWRQPLRFSCLTGILKVVSTYGNTAKYLQDQTKENLIELLQTAIGYFVNKEAISLFLNGHKYIGSYGTIGWFQTFTYNKIIEKIISDKPIPYTEFKTSEMDNIWTKTESGFKSCTGFNNNLAVIEKITYYNHLFQLHSDNGPTSIEINKKTQKISRHWYCKNGKFHREDGPATIIYGPDGEVKEEYWYKNGQLHREDGPAIKTQQTEQWLKYGRGIQKPNT